MPSVFDRVPTLEVRDGASRLAVHVPRPGVVVSRIEGHFSSEFARRFQEACDAEMRAGGFVGLHEWTRASSFDISVPTNLAAWTVARFRSIRRIAIATDHPIVGLAVRTANLTIKRIEHLDSVEALLAVVDEELRRDSIRPAAKR